jgi:hypothetical protein
MKIFPLVFLSSVISLTFISLGLAQDQELAGFHQHDGFFYYSAPTDKDAATDQEYTVKNTVFGVVFSATFH